MINNKSSVKEQKYINDLGFWNLYFFVKFFLFYQGYLNFHFLENLALLLFLLTPFKENKLIVFRKFSAIPFGVLLIYFDSFLPSIDKLFIQLKRLFGFNLEYLMELASRLIDFKLIVTIAIVFSIFQLLKYTIRFTSVTIVTYVYLVFIQTNTQPDEPSEFVASSVQTDNITQTLNLNNEEAYLKSFYQAESQRSVSYENVEVAEPFEVLLLNVCSLSWQDIQYTGLSNHIVFDKFDVMLQNFNTATSYSGPSAIRLLRASCGQTENSYLYEEAPKECYLFENLEKLGFHHELMLNHDGKYNDYLTNLSQYGGWNATYSTPLDTSLAQRAFDSGPIYSDREIFDTWMSRHQDQQSRFTFYQTISLHDGNKLLGHDSHLSSLENFHPRMLSLLNDLNYLFEIIEKSGRKVMVIMVPEHGAGIEGDKLQLPGMREFPTPALTHVPVGIKFFGSPSIAQDSPIRVNQNTSFLAISHILQQTVEHDVFGEPKANLADILQGIPVTEPVSQNGDSTIIRFNGKHKMRIGSDWIDY